ncbi:MAG TPA: holliday junction resolvasome, helicase subunit [Pseudomonas sp.]|nr:holliday junction resolvasome, helicase subunit [Pseudomonas sp.]
MSRKYLFGAALMLGLSGAVHASSFVVTTDTVVRGVAASTDATSDLTSSLRDDKIVQAARDDAASFVGTQGAIRGARLESALVHIRSTMPALQASDTQLAQAILAI